MAHAGVLASGSRNRIRQSLSPALYSEGISGGQIPMFRGPELSAGLLYKEHRTGISDAKEGKSPEGREGPGNLGALEEGSGHWWQNWC